ncbi:MAG TPA: winged helix-turn-helix domain-containing protein [Solirubrobacterales bacterium]|nr:winged helix-turn-helix domain-containing protein [Solirubrobacterales bacterium]
MFAQESGLSVRHCSYHFLELADAGCIVMVDTKQRRGATEHIYEPLETALAWTSEWENLPDRIKHGVLKSVLGGAVAALGSAIDGGTFEARDDSHMSWNTVELDEQSWTAVAAILDKALRRLLAIENECRRRIEAGAENFLASYFMASFESPPKSDPLAGLTSDALDPPESQSQRPTKDKRRVRRRAARSLEDEQQVMAKVMSHPTRVRILMAMNTPRRRMSPKLFAEESDLPVHHCAYHFAELEDTGCIALVATRRRRGAVEHIYEPCKAAIQWTDDWKLLGPAIKQSVLASVMRGAVEAVGMAIENGTFEARDDSHLSWSTIRVDEEGWTEITEVLDDALAELMAIDKAALERIEDGAPIITASYFMATFESPKGFVR